MWIRPIGPSNVAIPKEMITMEVGKQGRKLGKAVATSVRITKN